MSRNTKFPSTEVIEKMSRNRLRAFRDSILRQINILTGNVRCDCGCDMTLSERKDEFTMESYNASRLQRLRTMAEIAGKSWSSRFKIQPKSNP